MKYRLVSLFILGACLTSCGMARNIDQSTCDINTNTVSVERSTQAIHRNIVILEKIQAAQ